MEVDDLVSGARSIAEPGLTLCREVGGLSQSVSWVADSLADASRIRALAIAALDYLERHDGHSSAYVVQCRARIASHDERGSHVTALRDALEVLQTWADLVVAGVVTPRSLRGASPRGVAATDLMEQVRKLNADPATSPAAPIVLAGAALEVALRDLAAENQLEVPERPGMGELSTVLRRADVISKQQKKDIDAVAGVRNDAAHGNHQDLTRERAGLIEQQVNLLLGTLGAPDVASKGLD